MRYHLDLKREFYPCWSDSMWGSHTDADCYYRRTVDRNELISPRTTIPRFLQDRLRNGPRAVANGYEFPTEWSKRLRRLLRVKGAHYWPAYRIVHHE